MVLLASAVAVMAMGIYLFVQVRSFPAQASADHADSKEPAPHSVTPPPSSPAVARPGPPAVRVGSSAVEPPPATSAAHAEDPLEGIPNIKTEALMQLANKSYDKGDYEDAAAMASKILKADPTNVKMLRIMVSANCIQGDSAVAQQYYEKLPKLDRDQMKTRCDRYGVTFKDPPQ
jgi:tetratricopeptide (TPR) repeat protein